MAISVGSLTAIKKTNKSGGNMKKSYEEFYRVECNFGSKYFKTLDRAVTYFERKVNKGFDAELWLVKYIYCPRNKIYSASQKLLGYSATVFTEF